MSGLLSHSKNSIPVWFCLFWRAEELHALSYALLLPLRQLARSIYQTVLYHKGLSGNDNSIVYLQLL